MKTVINPLRTVLILVAVVSLFSCEKKNSENPGYGAAEFSISAQNDLSAAGSTKSGDSAQFSFQILISVEDPAGNPVMTDSLIPIYTFGSEFISENIQLKTGEYRLTKFMVINPSGDVIFAAPMAGSPLAYLVNRPLPFMFNIFPDQVTRIIPEVLEVGDHTPGDFGYASFGIHIIRPLDFWTMCILDNPLSMAPTQLTTAKLTVTAPDGWHFTFRLEAAINHLVIRGGYEVYYFSLEKEGYPAQRFIFPAKKLMETSPENPLILKIPWESQFRKLVLQPGPERGKDAMISNLDPDKNFGDHKYFEATFITEPLLTVMRSNRSLIFFKLDSLPDGAIIRKATLNLSYTEPVIFDSTIVTTTDPVPGIVWYGGVLQQVVEPWEEYSVTWNTQPQTIEANQVYVPPFMTNTNSMEIDVTRLYVPVNEIAAPNHGMLFRLWPSEQFRGFRFASSDYPEAAMRPKLVIYYTLN